MNRTPVTYEGTATTGNGGIRVPFVIREKLVYVSNDSADYELKVNFDNTIDQLGAFTLKPGEAISDVPMSSSTISVQGVNGSVAFRVMGV